jgi:Zn-dependent metalloprotease
LYHLIIKWHLARKRKSGVALFYSYSHKDEKLRNTLATHLSLLNRQGIINEWHDRNIVGGENWQSAIAENLQTADIVLLLISPDFIASDYCWGVEMEASLARHESGKARIIPILLRPVDLEGTPFFKIEPLPKNMRPVTLWNNRDQAWLEIAKGIRESSNQIISGHVTQNEAEVKMIAQTRERANIRKVDMTEELRTGGNPRRTVCMALRGLESERTIARTEGSSESGDRVVDEVYRWLGLSYDFFWNIFARDSIDGKGMKLIATVYHGHDYNVLYWVGNQLVIGDNEDNQVLFNRVTATLDTLAINYVKKMVSLESRLKYQGQAGSVFESFQDVFTSLIKQYWLWQKAYEADWLIGAGIFTVKVMGVATRSLKQPGTGYDDPLIGKDPQPANMDDYIQTSNDNGGVHLNSGIPNHAFFLTAIELGGYAWEKAGRIWYQTLSDKRLKPNTKFKDFAEVTVSNAARLYGQKSNEAKVVKNSWKQVGIKI